MKMTLLVMLSFLMAMVAGQSRANVQDCQVTPSGITDPGSPSSENSMIEIRCTTDTAYDFCQFQHLAPMDVGSSYTTDVGTHCNIAGGDTSTKTCLDDTRIAMQASTTSCGIRISNPIPDDTGKWTVTVGEISGQGGSVQSNTRTIELYTFNQSEIMLQEKRTEDDLSSGFEIWYNWDEDRNDWRSGTGGFEQKDLQCYARFGRPHPTFLWTINRDETNDLSQGNMFNIRDTSSDTHDSDGYIVDWVSDLSLNVNTEFLEYLAITHGIDINPESGVIDLDLDCLVEQGTNGEYSSDRVNSRIKIRREYFSGAMKGSTIGMIVGLVLAGVLLIVVVMLLFFAWRTERWCFAPDEYGYQDPRDQKRRPATQSQR